MLRILQVLANPYIGGTETFAINLSNQLSKTGVDSHILNLTNAETEFSGRCHAQNLSLITLGNSSESLFKVKNILNTVVRELDPVIIVSYGLKVSLLLRLSLPRRLRPRHVTGLRGLDTWRRPYHTILDSLTESRVAYFVGVSKAVLEQRRAREKTPTRKLLYIPNGIDTDHFHPTAIRPPSRDSLGLPEGRIFLTIANFREEKGHRFLLEAISNVRSLPDDVRFVWVGGGSGFEKMEKLVAESPVASKITVLPTVTDVREVLGHASLFLLPSRDEGMPRALMEAMAMSIPVLATNVGGVPELFQNEQPGFLVDFGNVKDMASKIQTFCDLTAMPNELGDNARRVIKRDFDFQTITGRYITLFKLIAEGNPHAVEAFRLSFS